MGFKRQKVITARESLIQAMLDILKHPHQKEGEIALRRLLNSYRVQAKPEENLCKDITAREELQNRIISTWQKKNSVDRKTLQELFSPFRMQIKQGIKSAKLKLKRNLENEPEDNFAKNELNVAIKPKNNPSHESAFFRKKEEFKDQAKKEPIAGGPKKKNNSRGICPKCRSLGLVLAPAFSGEDHYSCVYCGYRAFLNQKDPELDLPLAAEILGKFFDKQKIEG